MLSRCASRSRSAIALAIFGAGRALAIDTEGNLFGLHSMK